MQIENDYDRWSTGDIGYIDNVDPAAGEIVVSFDGRSVTYGFGELADTVIVNGTNGDDIVDVFGAGKIITFCCSLLSDFDGLGCPLLSDGRELAQEAPRAVTCRSSCVPCGTEGGTHEPKT